MTTDDDGTGAVGPGRGGRMSRPRKREAVLRLLRGEDLETVSRSLGVTAAALTAWRDAFLAAGEAALATRPADGETLESERLKARLGEMLLERELLEEKIAALEARPPFGPAEVEAMSRTDLAVQRQAVRARPGLPRLGRRPRRPSTATAAAAHGRTAAAGAGRADAGRRPAGGDPGACWPPARSTARATARSGRGCATAASAPRSGGCCG